MKQKIALSPNTFLWRKGTDGLMYNSETGNHMIFSATKPLISSFCDKMDDPQNLYVTEVDEMPSNSEFAHFLSALCSQKFGKIIPRDQAHVSLPPTPYVIHNVERINDSGTKDNPYPVLNNLSSLIVYLGGETRETDWFQQTTYPVNTTESIHYSAFSSLMNQTRGIRGIKYKIVVSNKIEDDVIGGVKDSYNPDRISFIFSPESLQLNMKVLSSLMRAGCHIVLVLAPEDINRLVEKDAHLLSRSGLNESIFLLDSEDCLRKAEILEQSFHPLLCSFLPVWNNNIDFLSSYVFLSKKEILEAHQTKRQIHLHQLVNLNNWGQMTIMPDERVFSDVNAEPLGCISDGLAELVLKELILNKAWRHVRNYGICADCIFQWLCPSPSILEQLSGYPVCHGD